MTQLQETPRKPSQTHFLKVWFMVVLCKRHTIKRRKLAANLHLLCSVCWLQPKPEAHFKHCKAARNYAVCEYINPTSNPLEPTIKLRPNLVFSVLFNTFLQHTHKLKICWTHEKCTVWIVYRQLVTVCPVHPEKLDILNILVNTGKYSSPVVN